MELFSLVFVLCAATLIHCSEKNKTFSEWDEPQEFKNKYPYYISGYTNERAPVWIIEVGKWDFRDAAEKGGEYSDSFQKYLKLTSTRWKNSSLVGSDHVGFVLICNAEGWNLRQMSHLGTIKILVNSFKDFVDINLDTSFKIIGVNVNTIAFGIWHLARPILGALGNNVVLYGTNPSVWRPRLLRIVPRDELPEYYGGSKSHKVVQYFG